MSLAVGLIPRKVYCAPKETGTFWLLGRCVNYVLSVSVFILIIFIQAAKSPYAQAIRKTFRLSKILQSKFPATRMSRLLQCSWMRGPRAEAPERTPKAEVRRSPHGAQDSKRKEFLHQQERRRRGLDLFGYFLGQAKKVTPGEGADLCD
jgi:hypothetical protein